MSKHPTPRIDQLRAMREAQFASNAARQKAAERIETPVAEKPLKAAAPAAAKSAPAKGAKKTAVKKAKTKKAEKSKKPGK